MKLRIILICYLSTHELCYLINLMSVVHSFIIVPNRQDGATQQILDQRRKLIIFAPCSNRKGMPTASEKGRNQKRKIALYGVWSKIQDQLSTSKRHLSFFSFRLRKEASATQPLDRPTAPSFSTIGADTTTNNISSLLTPKYNDLDSIANDSEQGQLQYSRNYPATHPTVASGRTIENAWQDDGLASIATLENVHTIEKQSVTSLSLPPMPDLVENNPQFAQQLRLHLDEKPLETNNTAMAELSRAKRAALATHKQLYTLPRINRNLSKLEAEFRSMIEHFANYSEADLLSIPDPRKRALFEGIASSSHSRPVYRAFEILFEDLLPLRYAGRIVFTKLKEYMATSLQQRQDDMNTILNITGMQSVDDIRRLTEVRLMFVSTASQLNSASYLTIDQIAQTGIVSSTATEVLGFDNVTEVLTRLNKSSTNRITFVDLLVGLWELSSEYCGLDMCNPQVVLHNILVELNECPPPPTDLNSNLDANRQRFSKRYDEMLSSFVEWEHLLPPLPHDSEEPHHEGRRMEVVRGCFAGAELPKVVEALRVVYVDYAGLRVAGDIIYKLAATILKRR